ncbi:MAG: ROK family protein [Planctomycetales bacterium]|nr:ROK family protein [Planctomycetales bacterium]
MPPADQTATYWIGFDLGGTKIQCTLFNENLKKVASRRRRTKSELGVDGLLDRIATTIRKLLDDAKVEPQQLAGIGIGCPGPVEWEKGIVRVAVNIGWENVAVGKYLKNIFSCPVSVLNDVDAGVYGEYVAGAAKGARTALGIFPGTGIGGGCVYDGQIIRGKVLTCMEIGHTKITDSAQHGGSGMQGTLETAASRLAVAGELVKLAYRGEAPTLFKAAGTDIAEIRSKTIAEAIAAGDKGVERVLEQACEVIGHAVANMVLLICPDVIVLGGGLVEAMPAKFEKEVAKVARRCVFECYRDEFEVRVAKLGDDAGTVGAAAWAKRAASNNPQLP